jgi:hypothetical protein
VNRLLRIDVTWMSGSLISTKGPAKSPVSAPPSSVLLWICRPVALGR